MNDDNQVGYWIMTWMHVRRFGNKRWSPPPKKYPSMPRAQWRRHAVTWFAVGAAVGAVLGRAGAGLAVAAALLIGLVFVAVGMWITETRWLRSQRPAIGAPPKPVTHEQPKPTQTTRR
jgi:hypothetical protein